ncbi:MAG: hypothetical protein MUQ96_06605 [Loktanella sp.]|nr:hypothetical protein [Loktanella sp.]MDO7665408.1 hypothetical protein [Loktanella sp.]MDO7729484.1 hypothetical protein [Loktanella sp.]
MVLNQSDPHVEFERHEATRNGSGFRHLHQGRGMSPPPDMGRYSELAEVKRITTRL